jgi:hypothetical protein
LKNWRGTHQTALGDRLAIGGDRGDPLARGEVGELLAVTYEEGIVDADNDARTGSAEPCGHPALTVIAKLVVTHETAVRATNCLILSQKS